MHLGYHASELEAATVAAAARYALLRGKASPLLPAEQYEQHPLVPHLQQLPPVAEREVVRAAVNEALGLRRNDKTNRTSTAYVGVKQQSSEVGHEAQVEYEGKKYHFHGHSTPEQAAHTYNALAQRMQGHNAQLNDLTGLQLQPLPAELHAVLDRPDLRGGHELLQEAVKAWRASFKAKCSSQYEGVAKAGERWQAQIYVDSQTHHLGRFSSELAAARMYDRVLIQQGLMGQPQCRLNFYEAEYDGDPLLAEWRGLSIEEVRKRCQREAKREQINPPTRSSSVG